ncbi:ribonuclease P protein component [Patescibacteria group bacterium]
MIPKEHRLITKADFARLFKRGRVVHTRGISLKLAKNKRDLTRFGIVISAKVSKKAVVRNKIRRRLRTSVGRRLERIAPGYDAAIMVRKDAVGLGFNDLDAAVERLLEKGELL